MNMRNNRRGFTLTELTIVLAVLAIVLTLLVSFTAMVNNSRQISTARLEALQDIRVAESIIENFIEGNKITTTFEKDEEGKTIPVENVLESGEKKLVFNTENKTLAVSGGANLTLERVESITFDYNGGGTEGIFYCTINYNVGNHDYDYTFCVYSYAGNGGD